MINWYEDKNISIKFSNIPNVSMRLILPSMTTDEKKEITKYPFINKSKLDIEIRHKNKNKIYKFSVPKGYIWDGATIPKTFWRLVGPKTDPKFLIPSLIHDILCENHSYVDNDRYFANKIFERLLYVSQVPAFNRWIMFHCVDNFQKFCDWEA